MACISLLLATICSGAVLVCQIIWPYDSDTGIASGAIWRDWGLLLAAATSANFIYVVLGQYIVELFPTVHRNRFSAVLTSIDALTSVAIPQIIYLEKYCSYILVLITTITTAISFLTSFTFLPETKRKPSPDEFSEEELLTLFANEELMQCKLWCRSSGDDNAQLLEQMENNEAVVT